MRDKGSLRSRVSRLLKNDAECQEFLSALARLGDEPRRAFRVNPLRAGVEAYVESRWGGLERVPWEPRGRYAGPEAFRELVGDPVVGAGGVYIQEPGAMEAVALLDPQPGETCLDLCAAPGSKSTQILERLGGRGWLVANEVDRGRAARLDTLTARHGALNLSVWNLQAAALAARADNTFDAVLIDAPCSGESFFAKRKDQRADVSDREVEACARRQKSLLKDVGGVVKPGGRIVYSTCTYSAEENEEVLADFLAAFPEFSKVREQRRWPHRDGVAGGYVALLRREGALEPSGSSEDPLADEKRDSQGLIRRGIHRWDGELDLYAATMSATPIELAATDVALSKDDALRYLRGEALPEVEARGLVRCVWQNWPLGPGHAVEGRVNNQLPKLLRVL